MSSNAGNSSVLSISVVTCGSSLETNISECLRIGAAEIFVSFWLPNPTMNLEDSVGEGRLVAEILDIGWAACIVIFGGLCLTTLSKDPDIPRWLSLLCIFRLLSDSVLSSETINWSMFATLDELDGGITGSGGLRSFSDNSSIHWYQMEVI